MLVLEANVFRPRDIQILLAAIGTDDCSERENRLKDAVVPAGRKFDKDVSAGLSDYSRIAVGGGKLEGLLNFGYG